MYPATGGVRTQGNVAHECRSLLSWSSVMIAALPLLLRDAVPVCNGPNTASVIGNLMDKLWQVLRMPRG